MKIIKRNGSEAVFDINKIVVAISKANEAIEEKARMTPMQIERIAERVVLSCEQLGRSPSVEEVQDMVERQIMAQMCIRDRAREESAQYPRTLTARRTATTIRIIARVLPPYFNIFFFIALTPLPIF